MSELSASSSFSCALLTDYLRRLSPFSVELQQDYQRLYLDTFDGLLHQAGMSLLCEKRPDNVRLFLHRETSNRKDAELYRDKVPRFATELPPSSLRRSVESAIKVRALLPVLSLQVTQCTIAVLNRDQKTVARIIYQNTILSEPTGKGASAKIQRVRVEPLRGYDKWHQRVFRHLSQHEMLAPAEQSIYQESLALAGIEPAGNSSKLRIALQPSMRADTALRLILSNLLQTMQRNEKGIRDAIDSEFLHDFRVSVRRTRSILSQIKHVFPKQTHSRFGKEFAWLGAVTTPLRDLDVYLLTYCEYEAELPPSIRDDLAPLKSFLSTHHSTAHRQLVRQLNSQRYNKLCRDWRRFVESAPPERSRLTNATRSIGDLANEQIWKSYRKVLKQGQAISDSSPAESLHELRKTCKKLRYLMEFFRSLYEKKHIRKTIAILKGLQDILGTFQDLEVQQDTLRDYADQMASEGTTPAATLIAMGMLVERLHTRQGETRNHFAERFDEFATPTNRRLFKKLFRPAASSP